ncbi:MAG: molecular chaperone DnaJ [Vicinamibacterales bacterium]
MDFYIVLGLGRNASLTDIKRAYRRLARRFHPDINPGDREAEAQFRRIAEAYETLSDPARRRRYDAGDRAASAAEAATVGFEGFDFSVSVSGAEAPTFGDLFAEIWAERARRMTPVGPERGADLHVAVSLAFEEAVQGGPRDVTVTRQVTCHGCGGSGMTAHADRECAACQGAGTMRTVRGHMVFSRPCARCAGTGRQPPARCPRCGGQQRQMLTEVMRVTIPAGVADGARVRVHGKGHAGVNGGPAGDLYLAVQVVPHPLFRREGDDLHVTLPVAIHEAALGARIEVPGIGEPVKVRVPPGTQSGQRFRLRERGVPSTRDGRRGDLIVEVRLVLPRVMDERSKELLREFGRLNGDDVRRELMPSPVRGGEDARGRDR